MGWFGEGGCRSVIISHGMTLGLSNLRSVHRTDYRIASSAPFRSPGVPSPAYYLKRVWGRLAPSPSVPGRRNPEYQPPGLVWARFSPAGAPLVALVLRAVPWARRDPPAPRGGCAPGRGRDDPWSTIQHLPEQPCACWGKSLVKLNSPCSLPPTHNIYFHFREWIKVLSAFFYFALKDHIAWNS